MSAAYAVNKTYAGLDVSLKDTAVRIVDDAGKIVFEGKLSSDPAVIAKCLERAGLESGMTSPWLWRELRQLGAPVICLDSRHAHRVLSIDRRGAQARYHSPRHLAQRHCLRVADH
jgi:transposase